jgi:hypothetical protein
MTTTRMIELAAAVAILGVGAWIYRKNKAVDQGYGSQGAVLLFVVGAIMVVHSLGFMEYRPTADELEAMKARASQ